MCRPPRATQESLRSFERKDSNLRDPAVIIIGIDSEFGKGAEKPHGMAADEIDSKTARRR